MDIIMQAYQLPKENVPEFPIDGDLINALIRQNHSAFVFAAEYDPALTIHSVQYRDTMIPLEFREQVNIPADGITLTTLPLAAHRPWARHLIAEIDQWLRHIQFAADASYNAVIGDAVMVSETVNLVGSEQSNLAPVTQSHMIELTHRMAAVVSAMMDEEHGRPSSPEETAEVVDLNSNPILMGLQPNCSTRLVCLITVDYSSAYMEPKSWRSVDFVDKAFASLGDSNLIPVVSTKRPNNPPELVNPYRKPTFLSIFLALNL
ncbi:hypothetical protein OF83DRAFT_1173151 [Amylostereum chailletii]|nr:hypothetical protein OF83DRAFT_1173151 [Amylostereum chailletii]